MKISIVTATYNSIPFISDCINSVKNQNYDDIEHIIIDGSSSDGTYELLKKNSHKFTKLISEPDKGIFDALNKGISISTGDIIGILHSDDTFENENVINLIQETFKNNSNVDAVIGNVVFFDKNFPQINKRLIRSNKFKPWMMRFGFMPAHTATFIRSSVINKIGNYKIDYRSAGDFEFFVRFFHVHKLNCYYLNKILVKMRMGGTSTSGVRSYFRTSIEILKALNQHRIYSNIFFILLRLPLKLFDQLIYLIRK